MRFLSLMAKGGLIGVGMILPGVSGGTLAVLLGIYEELIARIGNLRKDFKNSFLFLFPFALGMILAFAAMYFPLKFAIKHIPFELCMVFVALMVCSLPKLTLEAYSLGVHKLDILFFVLAIILCLGLCFIPSGDNILLNFQMPWYMYFVLFIVGILASVALVIPGISGSMLLLIIGLYVPLLDTISNLIHQPIESFVILFIFALGLLVGFFSIAKLMKYLLKRFNHQTKWAILGFVVASIVALFLSFQFMDLLTPIHIGIGCGCFVLIILGYILLTFILKRNAKKGFIEEETIE